jgi:hypothetical protein
MHVNMYSGKLGCIEMRISHSQVERLDNIRATFSPENFVEMSNEYGRIVIWGRNLYHTHYWITSGYYRILRRIGVKVVWLEDRKSNFELIQNDDFIIFSDIDQKCFPFQKFKGFLAFKKSKLDPGIVDHLNNIPGVFQEQQYKNKITGRLIDEQTYYDLESRTIHQPWGADLLYSEFKEPINVRTGIVFWNGSVWSQPNHLKTAEWGNKSEIMVLKEGLARHGIFFRQLADAHTYINVAFTRASQIAPSIQGVGQVEARHLACRFFKNIAYGKFPISNNIEASLLLKGDCVYDSDIDNLIDMALQVPEGRAYEMCANAQRVVRNYNLAANLYVAIHIALIQS